MTLEIRHLKLVAAIAEEGSVTKAGNRLHLTQSALSHQLRDAEEQLGRPLFERRSKKMSLTPAGERLLRSAREVLVELDGAEKEIQRSSAKASAVLRLSTQCYTAYHWLPTRLKAFHKKYPGVEVQLVVEATPHPFEALLDGKLDLAIAWSPIRNQKIQFTPLFQDELVVITQPGHPWTAKTYVTPEDFAQEDLIIYPPKEESSILLKVLNPAGVMPRRIRGVMLTEAIIELVKSGLGVAVLTKWSVTPWIESGELAAVRLTRNGFYREWSAAQLRTKSPKPYLEEFIRLLMKHPLHSPLPKSRAEGKRAQAIRTRPGNLGAKRKDQGARA